MSAGHPAQDFAQYVEWARKQASVDYSAPAAGSTPHFLAVALAKAVGFRPNFVAYSQGSMALADLYADRIKGYMAVAGSVAEQHRSGRVRMLAVTLPKRLPDVPTFAELGYPQLTADEWFGIFLPAGTPSSIVSDLHGAIAQAGASPDMLKSLLALEQYPVNTTPQEFAARLRSERARWGPIVKESGYKVEDQ